MELVKRKQHTAKVSSLTGQDHVTAVVPHGERRGAVTLGLLWITMVTGFPTVLMGFEWFKAGLTLPQIIPSIVISCLILLAYGIPSCYLGSKSGKTYSSLSRNVFGAWGSRFVSSNLVWVNMIWYGLNAMFLAEGLKGIYHWNISTAWLAAVLAIFMTVNNFFGFTGIANFARYLAAPVLVAWVGYTFFKVSATCPNTVLTMTSHVPFTQAFTSVSAFVIGYSVWGNEADYWRFGKPQKFFSAMPLLVSLLIGQFIFPVTGWMMAYMTGITEYGAATSLMNQYAFGGISIIAALVLIVCYFAVNDSGLYGIINGLGNLKEMPRKKVVAVLAIAGSVIAAWLTAQPNAMELCATISSVFLPSVTVVMMVEYLWFKPRFEKNSSFDKVASFAELPAVQWPAVIALLCGITVGIVTSGLIPGLKQFQVGIFALQAWVTSFVFYFALRSWELAQTASQRQQLENLLSTDVLASNETVGS